MSAKGLIFHTCCTGSGIGDGEGGHGGGEEGRGGRGGWAGGCKLLTAVL